MADKVVSHENAAGDKTIGLDVDGVFIPFATVSAGKVAQLAERHATLSERAEAGDEQAIAVLGSAFQKNGAGDGELASMNKADLLALASDKGIEGVNSHSSKADIVAAIESHDDGEGEA